MINHVNYSCDKCTREFSQYCKHCIHTTDKPPTKFKRNNKPKVKEFESWRDLIIRPKRDKLDQWKKSNYLPYNNEILLGYDDIRVIYKLGDGIHKWNGLMEVSLDEALARGYVYCSEEGYKIKCEFIPTRIMEGD